MILDIVNLVASVGNNISQKYAQSQIVKKIVKQDTQSFVNMKKNCKFLKRGICAYKHVTLACDDEKLKTLESELKILNNKNGDLINKLKEMEGLFNKEKEKTIILEAEIKDLEIKSKIRIDMIVYK